MKHPVMRVVGDQLLPARPLSDKTLRRIVAGLKRLMPKEPVTQYLVRGKDGRELGEGHGASKSAALVNLYAMDPEGPRITTKQAEAMIQRGEVVFEELA